MSIEQTKFYRGEKGFKTQIIRQNPKTMHKQISTHSLKKSLAINSNDRPDSLKEINSNVFKAEKLTNFRKPNKHMTELPHQLDKPDILLGLNEYKEIREKRIFHSIKKLTNFKSIPDAPDTLEPINEDACYQMPKPDSMTNILQCKNEEKKNNEVIPSKKGVVPSLKFGNNLEDIKEKEESEGLKTEENRKIINNDEQDNKINDENNNIKKEEEKEKEIIVKKEEEEKEETQNNIKESNLDKSKAFKDLEEQKKKLEEEKIKLREQKIKLEEDQKLLEEQKKLEEMKKIEEDQRRDEEKKENERKLKELEDMKNELKQKNQQNELKEKELKEIEEKQKEKEEQLNKKEEEIKNEVEKHRLEKEKHNQELEKNKQKIEQNKEEQEKKIEEQQKEIQELEENKKKLENDKKLFEEEKKKYEEKEKEINRQKEEKEKEMLLNIEKMNQEKKEQEKKFKEEIEKEKQKIEDEKRKLLEAKKILEEEKKRQEELEKQRKEKEELMKERLKLEEEKLKLNEQKRIQEENEKKMKMQEKEKKIREEIEKEKLKIKKEKEKIEEERRKLQQEIIKQKIEEKKRLEEIENERKKREELEKDGIKKEELEKGQKNKEVLENEKYGKTISIQSDHLSNAGNKENSFENSLKKRTIQDSEISDKEVVIITNETKSNNNELINIQNMNNYIDDIMDENKMNDYKKINNKEVSNRLKYELQKDLLNKQKKSYNMAVMSGLKKKETDKNKNNKMELNNNKKRNKLTLLDLETSKDQKIKEIEQLLKGGISDDKLKVYENTYKNNKEIMNIINRYKAQKINLENGGELEESISESIDINKIGKYKINESKKAISTSIDNNINYNKSSSLINEYNNLTSFNYPNGNKYSKTMIGSNDNRNNKNDIKGFSNYSLNQEQIIQNKIKIYKEKIYQPFLDKVEKEKKREYERLQILRSIDDPDIKNNLENKFGIERGKADYELNKEKERINRAIKEYENQLIQNESENLKKMGSKNFLYD